MTTTTNWEKEIIKIINGIGSPYGEGATYNTTDDDSQESTQSHLDKGDKDRLETDLQKLLAQQRSELLDLVEKEVIGEDEFVFVDFLTGIKNPISSYGNTLRAELRQKLSALRLEGGGK